MVQNSDSDLDINNNNSNNSGFNNLLEAFIKQRMTDQAKSALFIFENLLKNGWIKEDEFKFFRKNTLDSLGANFRQIQTILNNLDISLKK